jgi:hydroxypyruvate isomerase
MTAASLAGRALAPRNLAAQAVADAGQASTQFSVMIWTLNKLGTFDENLERVAQAGYHHVELVGEFKKWSEDDYRRILARMETLKISVDATSGGSLRRGCVSLRPEESHPSRAAIAV